ncbi:phage tail protein [Streptomyces sp. NRRL S-646]|uniref:phage tail protein n=1 Tax=Streptomyces sp. NRRL S-646 TaxID=1463917 RepID=UPI0004C5EEE0|nr:phage tail protein [Streptomyces sp. NRRL S-646]
MRLGHLAAGAGTNRVDLSWTNPDPEGFPDIRVVRRIGTHPVRPDDGVIVAEGRGLTTAADTGLPGETVHYYALFPFKNTLPADTAPDPYHLLSAMPTEPYGFAERLYGSLPALYRRYDTDREQLRRFLELPGDELDRLYSLATASLALTDPGRVDGRLLPLLADWIGWRTDYTVPVAAQRTEIRAAPRLYQSVGTLPALGATTARLTQWPSRNREFVHNVARTNQPERLVLWSRLRDGAGQWSEPVFTSSDHAYDGRPAGIVLPDGTAEIFYHTDPGHGWEIWTKQWTADGWQASRPVVSASGSDKHPAAARQGDRLWLFWQRYDPRLGRWRLWSTTRTGGQLASPAPLFDDEVERTQPAAVADGSGGVWLFWLESGELRWARNDGNEWRRGTVPAGEPPVHDDVFVLHHPVAPRLWVLWASRQERWTVAYRTKQSLDPAAADWSPVRTLPKAAPTDHDRQPAALPSGNGIELFWSTARHGAWSVDRATLAGTTWSLTGTVEGGPYNHRGPLALPLPPNQVLLAHRSHQGEPGTTTVDTRATAKLALQGSADDFQTYTPDGRFARNTVGVFLTPGADEPAEQVAEVSERLAEVLRDVLPLTCRPVIIS